MVFDLADSDCLFQFWGMGRGLGAERTWDVIVPRSLGPSVTRLGPDPTGSGLSRESDTGKEGLRLARPPDALF